MICHAVHSATDTWQRSLQSLIPTTYFFARGPNMKETRWSGSMFGLGWKLLLVEIWPQNPDALNVQCSSSLAFIVSGYYFQDAVLHVQ